MSAEGKGQEAGGNWALAELLAWHFSLFTFHFSLSLLAVAGCIALAGWCDVGEPIWSASHGVLEWWSEDGVMGRGLGR